MYVWCGLLFEMRVDADEAGVLAILAAMKTHSAMASVDLSRTGCGNIAPGTTGSRFAFGGGDRGWFMGSLVCAEQRRRMRRAWPRQPAWLHILRCRRSAGTARASRRQWRWPCPGKSQPGTRARSNLSAAMWRSPQVWLLADTHKMQAGMGWFGLRSFCFVGQWRLGHETS